MSEGEIKREGEGGREEGERGEIKKEGEGGRVTERGRESERKR